MYVRTTCCTRAHGPVGRVRRIASDVPYAGVVESLAIEVFPVHVLHAPEAARGDSGFLGACGDGRLRRDCAAAVGGRNSERGSRGKRPC